MEQSLTLQQIAELVGGRLEGDPAKRICGVAGLEEAGPAQITWIVDQRYLPQLAASRAGAVIAPEHLAPPGMPAVLVAQPSLALLKLLERFAPPTPRPPAGLDPTARVHPSSRLGQDVAVGANVVLGPDSAIGDRTVLHPNVVIGAGAQIGADCVLWPNVVVREGCQIGDRVILHCNVVIGSDGYGYELIDGRHCKIPQIGTVRIEDDVEIGAASCVDRGRIGQTVIGAGTKIDNLVQVAHNVHIGRHCIIVAQAGIAGSTRLGDYVMLGGKVGVRDHVQLGDGVRAAACCCISKDVPAGTAVNGIPAVENRQYLREQALVRRLPAIAEQLKDIARRVAKLEQAADH
ncbi:MAG: UDP-3-O-(3-hydroxymyristoyl)glucosamine N-acyltransferase [Phycisphaerae bacterium]